MTDPAALPVILAVTGPDSTLAEELAADHVEVISVPDVEAIHRVMGTVAIPIAVMVEDTASRGRGWAVIEALAADSRTTGIRRVFLMAPGAVVPEFDETKVDAVIRRPWPEFQMDQLIESFVADALTDAGDPLAWVEDAAEADADAATTLRSVRVLQRSFLGDRERSDADVEAEMIAEIDRTVGPLPRKTVPEGTVILDSGEDVGGIRILVRGRVKLTRLVGGQETTFHSRTSGRVVGITSIARGRPAYFTATTTMDTTYIEVSSEQLDHALQMSPTLAVHLVTVLLRSMARRNVRSIELRARVGQLAAELAQERDDLAETLGRLRQTQARLVESEKMATLGQLVAGVAHELNNPVAALERAAGFIQADIRAAAPSGEQGRRIRDALGRGLETETLATAAERAARHELAQRLGDDSLARRLVRIGIVDVDQYENLMADVSDTKGELETQQLYYRIGTSLRSIDRSSERIARLVQSLRSYARPGGPERERFDVRTGLDESILLLGHERLGVDLRRSYDDVALVCGSPGELNQVWTNLMVNALQAMVEDPHMEVAVDAPDPNWVRVRILDNGPGIAESNIDRIFEPSFTTKAGRVEFGLGMGLHLAKDIVVKHGGTIDVESEPGRTCFTVILPAVSETGECR